MSRVGGLNAPIALYVGGGVRAGGAERRFFRLFNYLRAQGADIRLCTTPEGAEACRGLGIALDDTVMVLPERSSASRLAQYFAALSYMLTLVGWLRRNNIAHIHFGQNPTAETFVYSLLARFACPFSVSLVDPVKYYRRNRRQRMYAAVTARFSRGIDCLSSTIKADFCAFLGSRYEQKCRVSPCSFTDPRPVQTGVPRDIDISLVARMVEWKGHAVLWKALSELARRNVRGLVVHVCGSGPLESEYRREFEAVAGQQIHIYYVDDPFSVLLRSKVSLSLQEVENYPSQSLLEAMLCGCAIVATDVGLTRVLLDESSAILIPADPVALAGALQRLLNDAPLRQSLGANAHRVLTTQHTVERFAEYFVSDLLAMSLTNSDEDFLKQTR